MDSARVTNHDDVSVQIRELSVLMENAWQLMWKLYVELFQRELAPRWNSIEKSLFCSGDMMTNYFQYLEYAWDCTEQSETVLVHSAQSGNLEAFNALVMKYQDLMYGLALRILGEDALAEDATQEAFISAYQHIVNFRGGSLKAWLMRILVNKCYDDSRRMQRTSTISLNEGLTGECEDERLSVRLQDRVPTVEECVEAAEQNEYIQKCLGKLPTDYRIILALVDIEEMSYGEASTILKVRMGTVKSRLARARLCLRRELNAGDVF